MNFLPKMFAPSTADKQASFLSSVMRREAKIGGELFGPIPKGHRREFFCLDVHTWVWHEEWVQNGERKIVTTRYDIRPNGILKSQGTNSYQRLSLDEARNLHKAVKLYRQRVGEDYRQMLQSV